MNYNIIPFDYNGVKIQVRESDGWINLTEMCKAYDVRLDNWMRLKSSKAELESLVNSPNLNYLRCEGVSSNPYGAILETKEGKKGGTWGHPLLAVKVARWINSDFANWLDAHSLVLLRDGKTSLDTDPFARILEIRGENYGDLDNQILIDNRFYDVDTYSTWTLDSGE
jgi:hypothetical protein